MTNLKLTKLLFQEKNLKYLTQLIQKNFNQMNHNTFWDTLKKEAKKQNLNEKVAEIAKLHVGASEEIDGVYFVEFVEELVVAHSQGEVTRVLEDRESELSEELVNVLLDSAQKMMASDGFTTVVPLVLEVVGAIVERRGFVGLEAYLYNQYVIYYLYSNQAQKALESIEKACSCVIEDEILLDRLEINRGLVLYRLGRYDEAIALYESMEDRTLNLVDFKQNLVLFYKELGNFSKALNLLYELLELVSSEDTNQRSKIYGNMANIYGVLGRKEKQREYLLRSLRASKCSRDRNYEIVIANYFNLANYYLNQECFDKGEFWLNVFKNSAKRIQRESDYFFNYALLKIRFFLKKDDFFSAKAIIEKIIPDIDQNASSVEYLSFLVQLGICHLGEKENQEAVVVFEKSIAIATQTKHNEFIQTIRGYLGISFYLLGYEERAKENIDAFFRQERVLREHIDDSLTQFYFSIDRASIYHSIVEILVAKNETLLLFEILQNIKSNAVSFNSNKRITYPLLIEQMDRNSVILDYYLKDNLLFCLVIEKHFQAPILVELEGGEKEILAVVDEYFETLKYAQTILMYNPFEFLQKVSEQILEPLSKYIDGKESLIICRSSHLNLLPMHIFPYDGGLLLEKVATSYALNSALIFFEGENKKEALLISSSKVTDSPRAKKYFEKEINYVEGSLKDSYKIEKSIEEPNNKERLFETKGGIVHLINHGTFSSNKPNSSGMFLKEKDEDIFVDIDELFRYKLDIESIFMSGCSTGEVQPLKGEEPLGIISYLHSNGVKSAILSSWKIPSEIETTVDVVRDFYRYWVEDGLSKSVALQRAMIDNKKINPYEYAGFVLFGGYSIERDSK